MVLVINSGTVVPGTAVTETCEDPFSFILRSTSAFTTMSMTYFSGQGLAPQFMSITGLTFCT